MLGIIIGISSVITVVALGNGMEESMTEELSKFGAGRIFIGMNWGSENIRQRDRFNHDDIDTLRRVLGDELLAIQQGVSDNGKVVPVDKKGKSISVSIEGAMDDYQKIQNLDIVKGRFLNEGDVNSKRYTIAIDEKLAKDTFGRVDVLGEKIMVETSSQTISFTIVGLIKHEASALQGMGGEAEHTVYIPVTTFEKMYGIGDNVWYIQGAANMKYDTKETIDKIVKVLERRHRNEGEDKYSVQSMESQMGMINGILAGVTAVISAIAAVSLLVGGIGVMNIMLVSVTERTREIGIRKALGAKYFEIMSQFLIESVIISCIGGMLGTLIGVGLSNLIASLVPFLPKASAGMDAILIAWVFSAGVGVVFGMLPASKAAKLNPIDALRYE